MQIADFKQRKFLSMLVVTGGLILLLTAIGFFRYYQQTKKGYYYLAVVISSAEMQPEDLEVMKAVIEQKLAAINQEGGINNRPVKAIYIDDKGDVEALYKLAEQTSRDPNVIAFVGCKGTTRAQRLAPLLAQKGIPFIARYVLTNLLQNYPNTYSSEIDFKDLAVVFANMLLQKSKKAAFIGMQGDLYSVALLQQMDKLAAQNPDFKVALRKWYPLQHKFSASEIKALADSLKQQADFLVLSAEPKLFNEVLNGIWKYDVQLPVYCGITDILQLAINSQHFQAAELYDINAFGVPGVQNMRIYEQLEKASTATGAVQPQEFQLGLSGRLVDEIGLIREAAADPTLPPNLPIRERISQGLQKYINYQKVYRGDFADWSFTQEHGFAGNALLSWKPRNYKLPVLAPEQFHFPDSSRKLVAGLPVLYASLDLDQISQVDDEAGSFYATFYLDLNSATDLSVNDLDFANAARNKINQEALVDAKLLRSRELGHDPIFNNYLYKVSGKFMFNPDLKRYPFDVQKFAIKVQPKNALHPFLVQPPTESLRDTVFSSVGWIFDRSFVGYNQELITIENDFSSLQQNISTYNFSFVYILKRAKIDFSLKVMVPLLALLVISYFSIYIPRREFEAMAGIQVTALLAAIALYFSTYKPEMQYATASDKIFIFTYIMITTLIGTSIYRYIRYHFRNFYTQTARLYQIVVFPLIVVVFTFLIR